MRLTKIIATMGPSCASPGVLGRVIRAGVDVVRINLSHGTHAGHARAITAARRAAARGGRAVALLADLQGPKVRIGRLEGGGPLTLRRGDTVILSSGRGRGRPGVIPVSHRGLASDVGRDDPILIDDGKLELRVLRTRGRDVQCRVITGGPLHERKGVNLPLTRLSIPSLTRKDRDDLDFALERRVDYIALSFVRGAGDLRQVRRLMRRRGRSVPLIAKLELRAAVQRLDEILEVADGVMVARGDLGVEVPLEEVPVMQKVILSRANRAGVLVITATQMLESMVEAPRPTRAEASDVANAIFDGTDAVMLSAETASGRYPVHAVRVMDRIAREAERSGLQAAEGPASAPGRDRNVRAVGRAAVDAARHAEARAIVVFTQTGATARVLSKLKPECPIVAFCPSEPVRRSLALCRGVLPLTIRLVRNTDRMLAEGDRALIRGRIMRRGQRTIVVSGTSTQAGATNMMKIHRVGDRP